MSLEATSMMPTPTPDEKEAFRRDLQMRVSTGPLRGGFVLPPGVTPPDVESSRRTALNSAAARCLSDGLMEAERKRFFFRVQEKDRVRDLRETQEQIVEAEARIWGIALTLADGGHATLAADVTDGVFTEQVIVTRGDMVYTVIRRAGQPLEVVESRV